MTTTMSTDHLKLPRSPHWPELRRKWIADHPTCAACGSRKNVEVHHKIPVHVSRSQELDSSNLITLCETPSNKDPLKHCHFEVGHLGNWFNYNKNVEKDAKDELLKQYPKMVGTHYVQGVANVDPPPEKPNGKPPAQAPEPGEPEKRIAMPMRPRRR